MFTFFVYFQASSCLCFILTLVTIKPDTNMNLLVMFSQVTLCSISFATLIALVFFSVIRVNCLEVSFDISYRNATNVAGWFFSMFFLMLVKVFYNVQNLSAVLSTAGL